MTNPTHRKKAARALAAAEGITYQQALTLIVAGEPAPTHADPAFPDVSQMSRKELLAMLRRAPRTPSSPTFSPDFHQARARALTNGWTGYFTGGDDEPTVLTLTAPTGPHAGTRVDITWTPNRHKNGDRGWRATAALTRPRDRTRKAALGDAENLLATPTGEPRPDTGCLCCGVTSPPEAGLTLTCVGLCYPCHVYHYRNAETVPDPDCDHSTDSSPWDENRQTGPITDGRQPWRADPRANLEQFGEGDNDDTEQRLEAFTRAGLHVWFGMDGRGRMWVLNDPGPREITVYEDWDRGEWVVTYPDPRSTRRNPAQLEALLRRDLVVHELIALFVALDAGDPVPEGLALLDQVGEQQ